MTQSQASAAAEPRPWLATLIANERITPPESPEDVRRLDFAVADPSFDPRVGQCVRVLAPGQWGQRWHERLYSIAALDHSDPQSLGFELLVRRCQTIDEFNGERYAGIASNLLCDLPVGGEIRFTGPVGHPFPIPEDRGASLLMIGMGTGVAPFRGLVRRIYDELGGWDGPVRLFYGARSGLEMLYQNEENADLALYYDKPTFQAFRAVSPRPHFGEPPALDQVLVQHAATVLDMLKDKRAHVFLAGPQALLKHIEPALGLVAGSAGRWSAMRTQMEAEGRWHEVLY